MLGIMKDEIGGRIMTESMGLRSKMYSEKVEGWQHLKKAEGVQTPALQNQTTFEDYLKCVTTDPRKLVTRHTLRSSHRSLRTNKSTLQDDKRDIVENGIDTLPWGITTRFQNVSIITKVE